jgi:hypothetical protein
MWVRHNEAYYRSKRKCCTEEISVPRTRDSVRRASDFVQIAITLKTRSWSAEPHAHLLFEFRQALSAFPFPPLVFSRAPLPDENAVAVRIRNRDFAALHIGGPVDSRYFDTIR